MMNKLITTLLLLVISTMSFGQNMTFTEWQYEATNNKRLLPKYGGLKKSKEEIKADKIFEAQTMEKHETSREASDHLIDLGFKYFYRGDTKTAMYRFNQAYLLDPENPNIYWGFGAIYMSFGQFDMSREQYDEGLKMDIKNDNILIDYGTTYLGEFYDYYQTDPAKSQLKLDKAIEKLAEAYEANPQNSNSSYKLSICYLYKDDCKKANEYLKISEDLGNPNITEAYRSELEEKCMPNTIDCSSVKTGKYKIDSELSGITLIERTTEYQIEENVGFGYKLKFSVTWINDCTYQLVVIEDLLNPENKELPTMVLNCTITEITDAGYIQTSSSDVDPSKLETELIRIE